MGILNNYRADTVEGRYINTFNIDKDWFIITAEHRRILLVSDIRQSFYSLRLGRICGQYRGTFRSSSTSFIEHFRKSLHE